MTNPADRPAINTEGGAAFTGSVTVDHGSTFAGRDIIGYTAEQISQLLTQLTTQFQPRPFTGRCPYMGLDVFTEDEADRFFGRQALITELIERVRQARFIVITGPSGSGKSSLVQAGILHALKKTDTLPGSQRWLYATFKPGRDPQEQLALALSRAVKSPAVADYLRQHTVDPDRLNQCVKSITDQRTILFVDQFEEVFTQVTREEERVAFINQLTRAATTTDGPVTVLCALRSDFVAHCAAYPDLNALLNQQFFQVGAMPPAELVQAIAQPALEVGLQIDSDLITQIMNDMQGEPGVLPLMQFALKDLFQAQQAKGGLIALTLNDYLARGGVHQALARHADAAFAQLTTAEQQIARYVFTSLIQVGSGQADTRRTVAREELATSGPDQAAVNHVITQLTDARLVTTDEQANRETVTLAHEKLIGAWPWLSKLVNENREAIALQNQIAADADEWNQHQRDASYLYTGARLANAREQLAAQRLTLKGLALAYVEAGLAAFESAQRRQRRITQIALGMALVFLALAGIAFSAGQRAEYQARQARAGQLGTEAQAALDRYPIRSLLLASEGLNLTLRAGDAVHPAENALRQALGTIGGRGLIDYANMITTLSISRDAQWLIACERTSTLNDKAHLWNVANRQHPIAQPLPTEVACPAAFSPDNRWLVTTDATGQILRWDLRDLTLPPVSPAQRCSTGAPRFTVISGDSQRLITASGSDLRPCIWPLADLAAEPIALPTHQQVWLSELVTSADGRWLVTAGLEHTLDVWELPQVAENQQPQLLTGFKSSFPRAVISDDSHWLVVTDFDTIKLFDLTHSPLTPTYVLTGTGVDVLAVSHDSQWLIGAGYAGALTQWNLRDLSQPPVKVSGAGQGVQQLLFSADGGHLLVTNLATDTNVRAASLVQIWSMLGFSASAEQQVRRGHESAVTAAVISPDSQWFATGSADGAIRIWPFSLVSDVNTSALTPFDLMAWIPTQDLLSPDRRWLVSLDQIWDLAAADPLSARHTLSGTLSHFAAAAISPDSRWLATVRTAAIQVWDLTQPDSSSVQTVRIPRLEQLAADAAITNDRRWVATAVTNTVWLYDLNGSTDVQPQPLTAHGANVTSVAFSPDNRWLASTSRASRDSGTDAPTLILWDLTSVPNPSPLVLSSSFGDIPQAQFSANGRWLVARVNDSSSPEIRVWDLESTHFPGDPVRLPINATTITAFALTSDAAEIAVGGADNQVYVFKRNADASDYAAPIVLQGHADQITSVAFNTDGRQLITASLDRTIRLWNLAEPLRAPKILYGLTTPAGAVAQSANGRWIISGSRGGLHLWTSDPASLLPAACETAGRDLSAAEWNQYFPDEAQRAVCSPDSR